MIVFPSATAARRAERSLASAGIPGTVVRPPASVTGGSCSHGLRLDCRALERAEDALTALGISRRGLWQSDGRGNWTKR